MKIIALLFKYGNCDYAMIMLIGPGGGRRSIFFDHLAGCHGKMVKNLTLIMAKISKLPWSNGQNLSFLTITMAKIYELPWSNDQNLTTNDGKISGCHGQLF